MAVVDAQDPAEGGVNLTKSDTTVHPMFRAFYVGGTGDVTVRAKNGNTVTFGSCPAGLQVAIRFDKLMSTGTSATLVTGLL
jgi:hypothetical protein